MNSLWSMRGWTQAFGAAAWCTSPSGVERRRVGVRAVIEALEGRRLLSAAGDLDLSFGFGGTARVTVDPVRSADEGYAVAVAPDGKSFVVGKSGARGPDSRFAVARFGADGKLDGGFGAGGRVTETFGGADGATAVVVQPDGKVLVGGQGRGGFAVARFGVDGRLDVGFGEGGRLVTPFTDSSGAAVSSGIVSLLLQPNGKIIAVGTVGAGASASVGVARYDVDGALDRAFGEGGLIVGVVAGEARGAVLQSDGRIVAAAQRADARQRIGLARFDSAGQLDPTFGAPPASGGSGGDQPLGLGDGSGGAGGAGGAGQITAGGMDSVSGVALQADGAIIVVGVRSQFDNDFALMRFDSTGQPDASFNGGAVRSIDFGAHGNDRSAGVAVGADGQIVAAGTSNGKFALAALRADGTLDADFGVGGKQTTAFSDRAIDGLEAVGRGLAIQADGRILVAGAVPLNSYSAGLNPTVNRALGVARYRGGPSAAVGTISGRFFNDANSNGDADADELPLVGWIAYNDRNDNGRVDADEARAVSGEDGSYLIDNLAPGTYRIRELRQDRWTRTNPGGRYPLGYYDVEITAGRDVAARDFGNHLDGSASNPGDPLPPLNAPPTARNDSAVTLESAAIAIDVLSNDTDDGQIIPASMAFATLPSHGTIAFNPASGRVTYTPSPGFIGADSFVYTVRDNVGAMSGLTAVNITVNRKTPPGGSTPTPTPTTPTPTPPTPTPPTPTPTPPTPPSMTDGPDFEPTITTHLPASAIAGSKAKGNVSVVIANRGNEGWKGPASIDLLASLDAVADAGDARIVTVAKNLNIKPGASKLVKVKFAAFPNVADGDYRILAQVDRQGAIPERDESNNTAAASTTITLAAPFVDLSGEFTRSTGLPSAVVRGKARPASLLIENTGNTPANGQINITFFASTDATLGTSDPQVGTASLNIKLKALGRKQYKVKLSLPDDLPPGPYRLIANIDSESQLIERLESNNLVVSDAAFDAQ